MSYNWKLADGYPPPTKGKVFSCFACGGGSTMGYKLAGYEVVGCNEIDPRMMAAYTENHHPKYSFLEDIRTFKTRQDLPEELFHLDILDGSPPCSSFSMAGSREDGWGVEKKFREGQSEQVLDTLFFDFIDLAKRLQSKVVVAENVKGLLMGEARDYYKKISFAFEAAGYEIQDFLLNAADMGVPQMRERVFFIGLRKDLCAPFMEQVNLFHQKPIIKIEFNEPRVKYGEIKDDTKNNGPLSPLYLSRWEKREKGDRSFGDITGRTEGEVKCFSDQIIDDDYVFPTITASGAVFCDYNTGMRVHDSVLCRAGSYPQDYNFSGNKAQYLIGMSVPPLMVAKIAEQIYAQWLCKIGDVK